MIEIRAINKILDTKSLDLYRHLNKKYFPTMQDELDFILRHNAEYGQVPDKETFKASFPKFPIMSVTEPNTFLEDSLVEQAMYHAMNPIVEEFGKEYTEDAVKATDKLLAKTLKAQRDVTITRNKGVDIIKDARVRFDNYKARVGLENGGGIAMGFPEIDKVCGGMQAGDVITLYARPGKGKSWLGTYVAYNSWKQGKKVLYYSGEMDKNSIGFRFDTFATHLSNNAMMFGGTSILDDYRKYTQELAEQDGVIVVTPADFKGSPTVDQLRGVLEDEEIDVLIIDQLSLMKDQRRGKDTTAQYGNISTDLKLMAEEIGKPIFLLAQTSREAEKDKAMRDQVPPLHCIEYADKVGQNTVKAIGMNTIGNILKLGLTKSRFGQTVETLLKWDKDTGMITPLLSEEELESQADDYGF